MREWKLVGTTMMVKPTGLGNEIMRSNSASKQRADPLVPQQCSASPSRPGLLSPPSLSLHVRQSSPRLSSPPPLPAFASLAFPASIISSPIPCRAPWYVVQRTTETTFRGTAHATASGKAIWSAPVHLGTSCG